MDTSETPATPGTPFPDLRFDERGLVPVCVQDAADGRVLMVAWADAEALRATQDTGWAHFHSRSRGRLWKKGESSGHVMRVEQILVDCDADTLLYRVRPAGPACHTGRESCFHRELGPDGALRDLPAKASRKGAT